MLSLLRAYLKHTAHSLVNVTKSSETADMVTFTAEIFIFWGVNIFLILHDGAEAVGVLLHVLHGLPYPTEFRGM